jgi:hypothetical protein
MTGIPETPRGKRDKLMNEIASYAAEAFSVKNTPEKEDVDKDPAYYLDHSLPYLMLSALHTLRDDTRKTGRLAFWSLVVSLAVLFVTLILLFK